MDKAKVTPNWRLKRQRELRNWTQQNVGGMVGVDSKLISDWERGVKFPSAYHRQKLCETFEKSPVELGFFLEDAESSDDQPVDRPLRELEQAFPPIWNVPYERNPLFTGREQVLQQLHDSLITGKSAALTQTISGLGGVGKTQIAVEYCYRHRGDYKAILWGRADSRGELLDDLVSIARLLGLPESRARDRQPALNALRQWMRGQPRWLLVLDNVESVEMLRDILPPARRGHVLLTTRTQATGRYFRVEVQSMDVEEGALLVLGTAKITDLGGAPENDLTLAVQISRELGGLPLALDQARAYIQETQCGLAEYLERFKVRRREVLSYRSASDLDYPHSVVTTWSLSFERIEESSATAADLLRACAFLHPDAIPEEFFTRGAAALGPAFWPLTEDATAFDRVIGEILKYSLIQRNARGRTLAVHRLVQAVLLDDMNKETRREWAGRLVKTVNGVLLLDERETLAHRSEQRYLLQALACLKLVSQENFGFLQAAQLVVSAAKYMYSDGYYARAEQLCSKALAMFGKIPGATASDTYRCLFVLVAVKTDSGELVEAQAWCERLRVLAEASFGVEHPLTAFTLLCLAKLYIKRGKLAQAGPLVEHALAISRSTDFLPGYPHSDTIMSLASLYSHQGKATQAEALYLEALARAGRAFGSEHSLIAAIHTEMAVHYASYREYAKAEQARLRALEIYRKLRPSDHPDIAINLTGLYLIYFFRREYGRAEEYYERAMEVWQRIYRTAFSSTPEEAMWAGDLPGEPESAAQMEKMRHLLFPEEIVGETRGKEVATASSRLAGVLLAQGQIAEAGALFWNALEVAERTLGRQDLVTIYCLGNLARFYQTQQCYLFAGFLYERALQLAAMKYKFVPAGTLQIWQNYIQFLRDTGRDHLVNEQQRQLDDFKNLNSREQAKESPIPRPDI